MSVLSFSEQRKRLDSQLSDPSLFEGEQFNYYKIAQHGLMYANNRDRTKVLKSYLDYPEWKYRLVKWLKSIRSPTPAPPPLKSIVAIDNGRFKIDQNGKARLTYIDVLLREIGPEKVTTFNFSKIEQVPTEYSLKSISRIIQTPPASEKTLLLYRDLKKVLRKVKDSCHYSAQELKYLSSAFHSFLEEFSWVDYLLSSRHVNTVLFYPHYHREGLIAACKTSRIKCIELQHGLIAENDLYYNFPERIKSVASKALFPDHLLVFGPYWKDVLMRGYEHSDDSVSVVGKYEYELPHVQVEKENIIFIGAQKNMAMPFVEYTRKLLTILEDKHPEWRVILKLHPLEKQADLYRELQHPQFELAGNDSDLSALLAKSKIQISIYSTTFFDALRHNVLNFSLQNYSEYADYASDMVKEKIALPLNISDDPIVLHNNLKDQDLTTLDHEYVFSPFDADTFRKILED